MTNGNSATGASGGSRGTQVGTGMALAELVAAVEREPMPAIDLPANRMRATGQARAIEMWCRPASDSGDDRVWHHGPHRAGPAGGGGRRRRTTARHSRPRAIPGGSSPWIEAFIGSAIALVRFSARADTTAVSPRERCRRRRFRRTARRRRGGAGADRRAGGGRDEELRDRSRRGGKREVGGTAGGEDGASR